jgi:hypothetical protein
MRVDAIWKSHCFKRDRPIRFDRKRFQPNRLSIIFIMEWILRYEIVRKMITFLSSMLARKISDPGQDLAGDVFSATLQRGGIKPLTFRVKAGPPLGEYATHRFRYCEVPGKR